MPLPSRQTTPAERTVDPRLARRAASERIKSESARSTPALGSPGVGPVRGGSAASASSSARAAAEPYQRPAVYAPDPQLVNIRYDRQIFCGSCVQMLDRNRFSDSQLKKAANKFDTMRREGSLKLIKPNGRLIPCVVFWVKVAHESMGAQTGQSASAAYRSNGKSSAGASSFLCARHATTHSPFLSSRSVDCRLEKDRKEFSDAMRAKDRAAVCKKCQAAAVDKEDLKRREVSLAYPLSLPSRMLTDFDWQDSIEADPWASVDPGGGNSSDSDLETDPVPPAHFDPAAAYRVHDVGGTGVAGGAGRGTQLAPVWDDDEDEW
ncbi:hypothetical protein OF846_000151 [Rhodotorula toruloides]|nr:hypothetical protein OF846_000151 [Rhodotorula toruloides]